MKKLAFLIFLFTACQRRPTTINPGRLRNDSLISYLKNTINPLLHNLQTERAGNILDSVYPIVIRRDDLTLTASWLRFKSALKWTEDDYDSAQYFAQQALALANRFDSSGKEILGAKIQLSSALAGKKEYDSALFYGLEGYYLAKRIDTAGLSLICLRIADIANRMGDLGNVRKFLFEGWEKCRRADLKTVLANRISNYYESVNQIDSAIFFLKQMAKDTTFYTPSFEAVRLENLAALLGRQKKYAEALPLLQKATDINRSIDRLDADSYFNLAAMYRGLQRYPVANRYLDTAMQKAIAEQNSRTIRKTWYSKAYNHADVGDYKAAFSEIDSAYILFPIELDSSVALKGRELEARFENQSKEQRIRALSLSAKIDKQDKAQQRIVILFLVITLVLLGFIGVLFINRRDLRMRIQSEQLQQQLLRSQMNPHFIFNSLGVLQSLVRAGAKERALKYMSKFARLVRVSLENSQKEQVILEEELIALENYLAIQKLLCEDKFVYALHCHCNAEEVLIPPMILQPFVENSILKGFSDIQAGGIIRIDIEKKDGMLHCVIEDNGKGLHPAAAGKKKQSSTIITQNRLVILSRRSPQKAKMSVTDLSARDEGHGVRVDLYLPFNAPPAG